jgi:hypothetical protein
MAVTPTYPGVYVQEVPSGVRTIVGVSTSVTIFIGMTKTGPMSRPVECTTYTDFVRAFSDDTTTTQLANHVKLFFLNGGSDCYVMRIASGASVRVFGRDDPHQPVASAYRRIGRVGLQQHPFAGWNRGHVIELDVSA